MWFNRHTTDRNYSGEQKVNFESPVPFSKCLRAKIYCNMNVHFDPQDCQTLLLKESEPFLLSLGSWTIPVSTLHSVLSTTVYLINVNAHKLIFNVYCTIYIRMPIRYAIFTVSCASSADDLARKCRHVAHTLHISCILS